MTKKTPILFIIFNRPETTKKVFETIRKYKPTELFIAADGPRANKIGEKERCEEARKITEKIDWPCKVKRLYRNRNLGCKNAVSSAITWFFKNVEEGIILEDDCLPDDSFFDFCNILLKKYRRDTNITHISGNNYQDGIHRGETYASYYFSKYPHDWGWATWKRAWKKFSLKIDVSSKIYNKTFSKFKLLEKIYWKSYIFCTNIGWLDTWDYQWLYITLVNGNKSITPNKNLVVNIGIGANSTHTDKANDIVKKTKLESLGEMVCSEKENIDSEADKYTLAEVYGVKYSNLLKTILVVPYCYWLKIRSNFKFND